MNNKKKLLIIGLALVSIFIVWLLVYPAAGVPVLAYHMVSSVPERYSIFPEEFDEQMRYLTDNGYKAVSLAEMVDGLAGRGQLPAKPVVITFDDGYRDNLTTALPIMEKYGLRGTVFVIASQVGQADYLTWDEIKEMQRRGTEIGSHTVSHAVLTDITLPEREREVRLSKEMIEDQLGTKVEFLAYPFGQFDASMFDILQQAGYRGACTGLAGQNKSGVNPYALKRVNVPLPRFGLWEFRIRLLRAEIYSKLGL